MLCQNIPEKECAHLGLESLCSKNIVFLHVVPLY